MSAVDWERESTRLRENLRMWGNTGNVDYADSCIESHILGVKNGRDRQRFWRQARYSEDERQVTLRFKYRDAESPRGVWKDITIRVRTFDTPAENLAAIAHAIEDIRHARRRGNSKVLWGILNQMYPPLTTSGATTERIVYQDRIVHRAHTDANSPFAFFRVDEDAPYEIVQAVYQSMLRRAHPDAIRTRDYEGNPAGLIQARADALARSKVINHAWDRAQDAMRADGRIERKGATA